jgi:hypothetical protein
MDGSKIHETMIKSDNKWAPAHLLSDTFSVVRVEKSQYTTACMGHNHYF